MKINMKRKEMMSHKSLFLLTLMKQNTFIRKKKRTCVKSLQQQPEFYLPDDCWEHIFSFIIDPIDGTEDKDKLNFKSLSLVSKHFLSITNRLIFSLKICYPQLCHIPRFFHRFSNLNSLDLHFANYDLEVDIVLALRDRQTLKSLSIFEIELKDENYVTSHYIDSFIGLKGLNSLKFQCSRISDGLLYSIAREGLPLKSFLLDNCTGYSFQGIYGLLSKCSGIKHLGIQGDEFLNNDHVSQLSLLLPDLVSINLSNCYELRESALFALIKNCRSLDEITMRSIYILDLEFIYWKFTYLERECVENHDILKDFDVNPQLKFLDLAHTSFINDEIMILFASVFPNLELLNLSFCRGISEKGICQILSRCCKLRHLDVNSCNDVRGLKMNFVVHRLEVLDLYSTNVDDETLYEISKSCCGLLKLSLDFCENVTEKGVMCVIENCTQLKSIDLLCCDKVNVDVVASMLSSRPSFKRNSSILEL